MKVFLNNVKDFDIASKEKYLKSMIIWIAPLVVLIGLVGFPVIKGMTPYWKNPTVIPATAFLLISAICFLLVRFKQYIAAVHLYAYAFIFAPFAAVTYGDNPADPGLAVLMVGGVLLASVLFNSQMAVMISGGITIAAVAFLFLLLPDQDDSILFITLSVVVTLTALVVIFKEISEQFERNRRSNLEKVNRRLKDHTRRLEQEIIERIQIEKELKLAKEKAEESDTLKSAFLASMNHELRTPLNHIIGFSTLIKDHSKEKGIKNYSKIVHNSGQNLLSIIEDIFSLSMAEHSMIAMRMDEIPVRDLYAYLQDFLGMILEESQKQNRIKTEFRLDEHLDGRVLVIDQLKVKQVMSNLVKNAVKFTESGKIGIEIKETGREMISLIVSDTGIGIPREKQQIIFEFFRQADEKVYINYGGLGVGLALSKKLADVMKGTIEVQSEPGKGSSFIFSLPVKYSVSRVAEQVKKQKLTDNTDLSDKTILIVDDDDYSLELLAELLLKTKCKILRASNGQEAFDEFSSTNCDVILMDLKMPEMDGREATRRIKEINPSVPIIAVTAYSTEDDDQIQGDFNEYVRKPVSKEELFRILEIFLMN